MNDATPTPLECLRCWWNGEALGLLPRLPLKWKPSGDDPGTDPAAFLRVARHAVGELARPILNSTPELRSEFEALTESLRDAGQIARAWLPIAKRMIRRELRRNREWTELTAWRESGGLLPFLGDVRRGFRAMRDDINDLVRDPWSSGTFRRVIGPPLLDPPEGRWSAYRGLAIAHPGNFYGDHRLHPEVNREVEEWVFSETWRAALADLESWQEIDAARAALASSRWFRAFLLINLRRGHLGTVNGESYLGGWLHSVLDDPDLPAGLRSVIPRLDSSEVKAVLPRWQRGRPLVAVRRGRRESSEAFEQRREADRTAVPILATLVGYLIESLLRPEPLPLPSVDHAGDVDAIPQALADLQEQLARVDDLHPWEWVRNVEQAWIRVEGVLPGDWAHRRPLASAWRALIIGTELGNYTFVGTRELGYAAHQLQSAIRDALEFLEAPDGNAEPAPEPYPVNPAPATTPGLIDPDAPDHRLPLIRVLLSHPDTESGRPNFRRRQVADHAGNVIGSVTESVLGWLQTLANAGSIQVTDGGNSSEAEAPRNRWTDTFRRQLRELGSLGEQVLAHLTQDTDMTSFRLMTPAVIEVVVAPESPDDRVV